MSIPEPSSTANVSPQWNADHEIAEHTAGPVADDDVDMDTPLDVEMSVIELPVIGTATVRFVYAGELPLLPPDEMGQDV